MSQTGSRPNDAGGLRTAIYGGACWVVEKEQFYLVCGFVLLPSLDAPAGSLTPLPREVRFLFGATTLSAHARSRSTVGSAGQTWGTTRTESPNGMARDSAPRRTLLQPQMQPLVLHSSHRIRLLVARSAAKIGQNQAAMSGRLRRIFSLS